MREVDALVIGAGFYGCNVALALRQMGFSRVRMLEREAGIMRRASYVNQARVHNGYHYPRSLPTGLGARRNFERFICEHEFAVSRGVEMIYAVARASRVSGAQFARFCETIGADCREDRRMAGQLFDPASVETCFSVTEATFDAAAIAADLARRLGAAGVDCRFGTPARVVRGDGRGVLLESGDGPVHAGYVFNCTYANLDGVGVPLRHAVKKELAEIALIDPPRELEGRGITVMDGPYFSSIPFPALSCYSLTHVRYTPHAAWTASKAPVPEIGGTRAAAMIRDAARYLPVMRMARHRRSLFEIKAVLALSEDSDGRPIVFEQAKDCPRIFSVLGSKIDGVYDAVAYLKGQQWKT